MNFLPRFLRNFGLTFRNSNFGSLQLANYLETYKERPKASHLEKEKDNLFKFSTSHILNDNKLFNLKMFI